MEDTMMTLSREESKRSRMRIRVVVVDGAAVVEPRPRRPRADARNAPGNNISHFLPRTRSIVQNSKGWRATELRSTIRQTGARTATHSPACLIPRPCPSPNRGRPKSCRVKFAETLFSMATKKGKSKEPFFFYSLSSTAVTNFIVNARKQFIQQITLRNNIAGYISRPPLFCTEYFTVDAFFLRSLRAA